MLQLVISLEGTIQYIFNDELVFLQDCGDFRIKRASHVEPDGKRGWFADMSPILGPILGPFKLRSEALQAELNWLNNALFAERGHDDSQGAK